MKYVQNLIDLIEKRVTLIAHDEVGEVGKKNEMVFLIDYYLENIYVIKQSSTLIETASYVI